MFFSHFTFCFANFILMQFKKYPFLLFVFSSILAFAQNKNTTIEKISIEKYADLKAKGLLKPNVNYAIGGSQQQLEKTQAYQNALANIEANQTTNKFSKVQGSDSCRCFQKVDTTFSVVPFVFANPPDYRNDDGSSPLINFGGASGFSFTFFGQTYTSCYINLNGNITFSSADPTFNAAPFPTSSGKPMIAPFWGDVDTRLPAGGGQISGLPRYKITPHYMVVSWDSVGYYAQHADKRNTFQVIISDGTDSIVKGNGNVAFCYSDMQWTTGDASMGVNGFGGNPTTIGFDKGDGVKFAQLGRFDQIGTAYDGPGGNNDGVDWLDNKSFSFNTQIASNFPPVAVGSVGECNVINICNVFDTLYYEAKFVGPEIGQIINMNAVFPINPITNLPYSNFFIKSQQNGTTGKMVVGVVNDGSIFGQQFFSITGTDNGIPSQSSSVFFTVNFGSTGSACPNAVITGKNPICTGTTTTLKKPSCGTTQGIWNTGSILDSITVPIGEYYYTLIDSLGCSKSYIFEVKEAPKTGPVIKGPDTLCTSTVFYYTLANSLDFLTYQWQNLAIDTGIVVDANLISGPFQLTLTATNIYGCKEIKTKTITAVPEFQLSVDRQGSDPDKVACPFEVSKYKATPTNLGIYTYNWIDVNTNNEIGNKDTLSVIGPKNISVIVKKKNVCTKLTNIKILPRPAIPVTIATNKIGNIICPIDTLKLSAVSSVYFPPFKYKWQPSLDSLQTISPNKDTTYLVNVKDKLGCQGNASFTIIRIPNIEATGEDFCKGYTTSLRVKSFTGVDSIKWTSPLTSNLPKDSVISTGIADKYLVTLVDKNNCKMFDTVVVNYFFQPALTINTTANAPQLVTTDFDVSLLIQPYNPKYFKSIKCDFGDGTIVEDKTSLKHQYAKVDKYPLRVSLYDTNGCVTSEIIYIQTFDPIPVINTFTPNGDGVNDVLSFKYLDLLPDNKLQVFDRWGKLAYEKNNYANDWSPKDLRDGTYFYVLEITNPGYNKKFNGFIALTK
jgi:gliding motility-associated-like protein